MLNIRKLNLLNGNVLKIIAAFLMLIDHIGLILFPDIVFFRIIGRLSFPIFAFMIAEGCKYTKNKTRYLSVIFVLAIIYQIVYYLFNKRIYLSVLFTFSFAIMIIYALQNCKNALLNKEKLFIEKFLSIVILFLIIMFVYAISICIMVDYGFWGCMLPVFASIFHNTNHNELLETIDTKMVNLLSFSVGLIILCINLHWDIQYYSLLSLILLFTYSGSRGKYKMKYFFYVFYPVHLVILYALSFII